jgi:hypothetical protein
MINGQNAFFDSVWMLFLSPKHSRRGFLGARAHLGCRYPDFVI